MRQGLLKWKFDEGFWGLSPDTGHLPNALSRLLSQLTVILWLVLNGESDQFQKMFIIVAVSQGGFDVNLLIRKEATP